MLYTVKLVKVKADRTVLIGFSEDPRGFISEWIDARPQFKRVKSNSMENVVDLLQDGISYYITWKEIKARELYVPLEGDAAYQL